jgi:LuxR family transcriptional regulator, maltose regulon positive regulatory protein
MQRFGDLHTVSMAWNSPMTVTTAGDRAPRLPVTMPAEAPNRAKLRPPRSRSAHVPRRPLLSALQPHRGIALVVAPPGYGKTTVLAQWAASDERSVAWLSLDEADNDPVVLWSYLTLAVGSLVATAGDTDPAPPTAPPDLGTVVSTIVESLQTLGRDVVLVLDDFHAVTSPVCLGMLGQLLERQPDNVTTILSGRADPTVPIGSLRVHADLLELRAADLAFTLDEARAFLNDSLVLGLSDDAVTSLWERAEGWPAALYLASLSLRDAEDRDARARQFHGFSRHVVDYLTEVVLDAQSERTREFLLGSSILERMTGPLCDAVLVTDDSTQMLEALERANLFLVALDDHREWYRYHRLFVEWLRDVLARRDPERVAGLHHRAAEWFRGAGDTGMVIRHALAAGDREMAIAATAGNYLRTLEWGGVATLEGWLREFSREDIASHARLSIVEAWLMTFQGRYAEADLALENAARADYRGPLPDGAVSVESSAALIRASAPRDDIGQMLRAARMAFDLESGRRSMWHVTTHVQLGWALILSGEFAEAEVLLERAALEAPMTEQWLDAIGARCLLAWANLYQGLADGAERWALEAAQILASRGLAHAPTRRWVDATVGAVRAAQGRIEEASELLEPAVERMRTATPPILLLSGLLALAPVRRALGQPAEARALLDEAAAIVAGFRDPGILRSILERVVKTLTPAYRHIAPGSSLTERELDVLRLLEQGLSKRDIAQALFLSFNTVHSHTKSIYRKLGVFTREDAVRTALERGILEATASARPAPRSG